MILNLFGPVQFLLSRVALCWQVHLSRRALDVTPITWTQVMATLGQELSYFD